jgi:hypothetical protein
VGTIVNLLSLKHVLHHKELISMKIIDWNESARKNERKKYNEAFSGNR